MVQTGLQRSFEAKLRTYLGHALKDRWRATAVGIGVTAALQSSTATALLVTGFASDGIITLGTGLAVMLGANVGTTLIVQALSFDATLFGPALILAGVVVFRRTSAGLRDFGRVLIGSGLMLLALKQLVAVLTPIAADPASRSLITLVAPNVLIIIVAGAAVTWAVHSSAAVVLLAASLAASGTLPLPMAYALVLGANLGTAINPLLEGPRGKNLAGRRLAVGNLFNRIFGSAAALVVLQYLPELAFLHDQSPARAVANFHTLFNLLTAALFLPFLTPLAHLLERWIPEDAGTSKLDLHWQRSLITSTSTQVVGVASRQALHMADTLEIMLFGLKEAFDKADRRQIGQIKLLDDELDQTNTWIKNTLLDVETKNMDLEEGNFPEGILEFCINIEHAGDLIDRNLLGIVTRCRKRGFSFSQEEMEDLGVQTDRLIGNLRSAAALFISGDEQGAHRLAAEKETFRLMEARARRAHFERLRLGDAAAIATSSLHLDALRDLKRINAHLVEAAAYPILRKAGALLPTRIRIAG